MELGPEKWLWGGILIEADGPARIGEPEVVTKVAWLIFTADEREDRVGWKVSSIERLGVAEFRFLDRER